MASSKKYNARSISFPSRSHPSTTRVEEHLNKLNTWQNLSNSSSSDSDSLSNGVSMLEELYILVDDLLNMGSTQQVLSQNHHNVEALLESSLKLLDVCGVTRDILSQTNEHVREVQSAMRRRRNKGDSSLEACVSSYACFRKKVTKKDVKKLVSTLRQVDKKFLQDQDINECNNNDHFYALIRVLRQVCARTALVFQSLLSFVAVSHESKHNSNSKWSLVAKFVHKGVIACEDQCVNEFEKVDSELGNNNVETFNIGDGQRSLEALENRVDELQNGLEIVFRRLIKTRASLLNIISQ